MSMLGVRFNEADVSAAFETRDFYFSNVLSLGIEPQIFFEIVIRHQVAPHFVALELAVFYDHNRATLNDFAESVRAAGDPAEEAMQKNENHAGANRSEEAGAAIDGA